MDKRSRTKPIFISEDMRKKLRLISTTHSMYMGEMVEYLIESVFKKGEVTELVPGIKYWRPHSVLGDLSADTDSSISQNTAQHRSEVSDRSTDTSPGHNGGLGKTQER